IHFIALGGGRPETNWDHRLLSLAWAGWSGVTLFFVLSGYLITGILYNDKGSEGYFRNFYIRRTLRIFPLYYGTLAAAFLIWQLLAPHWQAHATPGGQVWLWTYITNYGLLVDWRSISVFGHFWSLAIEEHFYLLWPIVILRCSRRQAMAVCCA